MDYLFKDYKDFKSDVEVYEFIRKSFPDINVDAVKGSYLTFLICFFAYVSFPVTVAELSLFLGEYMGSGKVYVRISELVRKGFLKEYSFDECQDMNSRKAYYLSPQKQQDLISMLPVEMGGASNKFRKTNGRVPMHDYGIGMSLLQFMVNGSSFSYKKEVSYSTFVQRKEKGSLCVDIVVNMKNSNETFYVEQDMGTEGISVLCGKLYAYEKNGIHKNRGALLISSHIPCPYSKCPSYHAGNLQEIENGMREEMMNLYDYYECSKEMLDEKVLLTLKALLLRTGICDTPSMDRGAALASLDALKEVELVLADRGAIWDESQLHQYIEDISHGKNIYRNVGYINNQLQKAGGRFQGMCALLCGYIRRNAFDRPEIRFLLSGFPCLFYPTLLLSHCFDFLSFKDRGAVEDIFRLYFKEFNTAVYSERGYLIDIENESPVLMNHVYELADGTLIIADYIGVDVSAFIRFYYLYYLRKYLNRRICLVGIGDRADILYMCNHFVYYPAYGSGIAEDGLTLCFMDKDLIDGGRLYLPYKRSDDDVILVEMEDMASIAERKKRQDEFRQLSKEQRASMSKMEIARAMGILSEE